MRSWLHYLESSVLLEKIEVLNLTANTYQACPLCPDINKKVMFKVPPPKRREPTFNRYS